MTNNQIIIFDTTLRDGEQAQKVTMTNDEKIRMAIQLETLGVDVIEAGFPIASSGEWHAVNQISQNTRTVKIAGLSRAVQGDIVQTATAIAPAIQQGRGRIHTFIATSDMHMKVKYNKNRDQILETITSSVSMARGYTDNVQWSGEDASQSDIDFLCRAVETAITAGATTINLPDTVGYVTPEEYAAMFVNIMNRVPNADQAVFSAHCHNDLGHAVNNSLAAIGAGVRQVECTVNGVGERAGNASLEQIAMNIVMRPDRYPYQTRIVTEEINKTSKMLMEFTRGVMSPNTPIVGENAFVHSSGIHQDGMVKSDKTYEIMDPAQVGAKSSFRVTKYSGQAGVKRKLEELDVAFEVAALPEIYKDIIEVAETEKSIPEDRIVRIAHAHMQQRLTA